MQRFVHLLIAVLWLVPRAEMAEDSIGRAFDEVQIKPVTQRPCLLVDRADIPEVKRRLEALPDHPPANPRKMDYALYALLYGDEAAQQQATAEFLGRLRKQFNGSEAGQAKLAMCRRINEMLYAYDIIASFGCLTPDESEEIKSDFAGAARLVIGEDPARFPSKQTPSANGFEFPTGFVACNRWVDQFQLAALVGLNFPELPQAKAWVGYAVQQIQYILPEGNWDGAWDEVPRYHNWTMLLCAPLFQALQRRTGADFFQDRNTKALLDWYVRFSSPLVRFPETTKRNPAGEPTLPVWGDSNYGNEFAVLAMYAPHYATSDPAFSRRLMWMWRRAGSPFQHGWDFDLIFPIMTDPGLPDEPQTIGSELCRKIGYVALRAGFNTPEETVVYLRGGQRGLTHARSDLGSIDLFSHGIPLALGSQSGPYVDGPAVEWNRSQVSNNDIVFGGKSRDRRESTGRIDGYFTSPQVDYIVANCSRPPSRFIKEPDSFHWRRHLLLVKNPHYLVVWDEISSSMPSEWFLHTTAEKLIWGQNLVTSHTAYDADLDVHVLSPVGPLTPNEREGVFGTALPGTTDPKRPGLWKGKEDPYPFNTLKYFSIPAKAGENFLTVLHPRQPDGPPLKPTLVSASKGKVAIQVVHGDQTDFVSLGADGAAFQREGFAVTTIPMTVQESPNQ